MSRTSADSDFGTFVAGVSFLSGFPFLFGVERGISDSLSCWTSRAVSLSSSFARPSSSVEINASSLSRVSVSSSEEVPLFT